MHTKLNVELEYLIASWLKAINIHTSSFCVAFNFKLLSVRTDVQHLLFYLFGAMFVSWFMNTRIENMNVYFEDSHRKLCCAPQFAPSFLNFDLKIIIKLDFIAKVKFSFRLIDLSEFIYWLDSITGWGQKGNTQFDFHFFISLWCVCTVSVYI